jgi:hypothetical protein
LIVLAGAGTLATPLMSQEEPMQIHPEIMSAVVAEHVNALRRDAEKRRMLTPRTGRRPSGRVSRLPMA